MKIYGIISVLSLFSSTILASGITGPQPTENAESVMYPAIAYCAIEDGNSNTAAEAHRGALRVTDKGTLICNLPIRPTREIEKVVISTYAKKMYQKSCKIGYVQDVISESPINNMTLRTDGARDVWHIEAYDAGAVNYVNNQTPGSLFAPAEIYNNGEAFNSLVIICEHDAFSNGSSVNYGTIRVDYRPAK